MKHIPIGRQMFVFCRLCFIRMVSSHIRSWIVVSELTINMFHWQWQATSPDNYEYFANVFMLFLCFVLQYLRRIIMIHRDHQPIKVYNDGKICLDILQNRWSPTYDVAAILTSIQSLLHDPNPNSPANGDAAQLYQENRDEYWKRVKETVEQSWVNYDVLQAVISFNTSNDPFKTDFVCVLGPSQRPS